jgi:hypothetical protein
MIAKNDLKTMANDRLQDAEILHRGGRHAGAIYLCGYAMELALKARICKTLKWTEFPETNKEFQDFQSFKVHKLDILLKLSGVKAKVERQYKAHWTIVST